MGRIEVITGSMFGGKTEELIRRVKRARFAKQNYLIFKPKMDGRYSKTKIVSHDGNNETAIIINEASQINEYIDNTIDVVAIEEAQFLGDTLLNTVLGLKQLGIKVIVAGLDMTYEGAPFHNIAMVMGVADKVSKLKAVCKCGSDATHTNKLVDSDKVIEVGGADMYEPLCYTCWRASTSK